MVIREKIIQKNMKNSYAQNSSREISKNFPKGSSAKEEENNEKYNVVEDLTNSETFEGKNLKNEKQFKIGLLST